MQAVGFGERLVFVGRDAHMRLRGQLLQILVMMRQSAVIMSIRLRNVLPIDLDERELLAMVHNRLRYKNDG